MRTAKVEEKKVRTEAMTTAMQDPGSGEPPQKKSDNTMIYVAAGGVVMLLTAAIPALNRHRLDNLGEVFIQGGAIVTLWLLTRRASRQAQADSIS